MHDCKRSGFKSRKNALHLIDRINNDVPGPNEMSG